VLSVSLAAPHRESTEEQKLFSLPHTSLPAADKSRRRLRDCCGRSMHHELPRPAFPPPARTLANQERHTVRFTCGGLPCAERVPMAAASSHEAIATMRDADPNSSAHEYPSVVDCARLGIAVVVSTGTFLYRESSNRVYVLTVEHIADVQGTTQRNVQIVLHFSGILIASLDSIPASHHARRNFRVNA
jgi:hypothetical protein